MKITIALVAMISCTVVANLLLKAGAMVPSAERFFFELISWKMVIGIFVFGCAALIYAWLLHWLPLNVVQSFAAAQFIAVILASAIVPTHGGLPERLDGLGPCHDLAEHAVTPAPAASVFVLVVEA